MKNLVFVLGLIVSFKICASSYQPCSDLEIQSNTCVECGATCVMRYSEVIKDDDTTEKILTVSGEGELVRNYDVASFSGSVTKIVVEEGITKLGFNAFYNYRQLNDIKLPSTLEELDEGSLQSCLQLKSLILPDGVLIRRASLQGSGLVSVVIPENATLLGTDEIFGDVYNKGYGSAPLEKIYCSQAQMSACRQAVAYLGDAVQILRYEKKDDTYIIYDENAKVVEVFHDYDDLANGKIFAAYHKNDDGSYTFMTADGDVIGYRGKRIYTVEEAALVSKPTGNIIKLRYK